MSNSLKYYIIEAFKDIPMPDYELLTPHKCDECDYVKSSFRNQHWLTIDPRIIENCYDKLPLLSQEGYQYFLPAYMIYALNSMNPESEVIQFLIYSLLPSKEERDYFRIFSISQIKTIYHFLLLVRNDERFYVFNNDLDRGINFLIENYSLSLAG
jgi:hypothetical protein